MNHQFWVLGWIQECFIPPKIQVKARPPQLQDEGSLPEDQEHFLLITTISWFQCTETPRRAGVEVIAALCSTSLKKNYFYMMGLPFPEIPSSISLKLSFASCLQEAEPGSCSDMSLFLYWTRSGPWTMLAGRGLSLQNNFHKWWLGLQSHETALTSPGVICLANLLAPFGKWPGSIWPIRLFSFYSTFQLRHRMLTNTDAVGFFFFLLPFPKSV